MKRLLIALAVIGALVAAPVFASTITGATYVGTINIANVGTVASNVSFPVTISTSNLITQGFIASDCENTCIQIGGADVAYMPARTGQTTWMVFAPSVPVGTSTAKLYTGGPDMGSKIRYFPGKSGYTTVDSIDLELGVNFKFELKGYFDFGAYDAGDGSEEYLLNKPAAIDIYYSGAGSITAAIYGGGGTSVQANGLTSGEHTLIVQADGTNLKIYWDGVEKVTGVLGAANVPDNASAYQFIFDFSDITFVMPYMEYQKMFIPHDALLPEQHIVWENGATFTDLSGNGHFATPTWRTTTSDADVTATLDIFTASNLSVAEGVVIGGGVDLLPGAPDDADFPSGSAYDEGETGGLIIDELVNEALATADIPEAIFWYPVAFVIAIAIGFGAYGLTKSLLVQSIVSAVVMAGFCGGGVLGDGLLPWFTVVIFGVEAAMLLVIQEKFAA